MLVGVVFYSFMVGNFASITSGASEMEENVLGRIQALIDLSRRARVPFSIQKKIKNFIQIN
jgi:hypothetical protein